MIFLPLTFCQPLPHGLTWEAIWSVLYLGVGIGTGVYLGFNWAMRWLRANVAGILGNITPICSLVLARILLDEQFKPIQMYCILLALLGIGILSIGMCKKN